METLTVCLRQKSQQSNFYNQACKMLLPCRLLVLKCKIKKKYTISRNSYIHEQKGQFMNIRVRQIQYIKITKNKKTKQVTFDTLKSSL